MGRYAYQFDRISQFHPKKICTPICVTYVDAEVSDSGLVQDTQIFVIANAKQSH